MKKINLCLIIWMVMFSTAGYAQDEIHLPQYGIDEMNSVHLEFFGSAGSLSVHYERMFNENIGVRGGLGYFRSIETEGMTFPLLLICLIEDNYGSYELGIGGVYLDVAGDTDDFFGVTESGIRGSLFIGYRFETDGGILRFGFAPVFSSDEFYPYGCVSWGITF